jgi:hypothetical protein
VALFFFEFDGEPVQADESDLELGKKGDQQ